MDIVRLRGDYMFRAVVINIDCANFFTRKIDIGHFVAWIFRQAQILPHKSVTNDFLSPNIETNDSLLRHITTYDYTAHCDQVPCR